MPSLTEQDVKRLIAESLRSMAGHLWARADEMHSPELTASGHIMNERANSINPCSAVTKRGESAKYQTKPEALQALEAAMHEANSDQISRLADFMLKHDLVPPIDREHPEGEGACDAAIRVMKAWLASEPEVEKPKPMFTLTPTGETRVPIAGEFFITYDGTVGQLVVVPTSLTSRRILKLERCEDKP